jgi:hypothetical protein
MPAINWLGYQKPIPKDSEVHHFRLIKEPSETPSINRWRARKESDRVND